ncbi:Na+/phosphate symporter [Arthrobacter sp. UYNi723]
MSSDDHEDSLPTPPGGAPAGSTGMPLAARRIVLIGAACVLVGILAGRFVFGGLVLASAGTGTLAVALSYSAGLRWFSPLSWLVSIAGAIWTAATAGYWWVITAAADASAAAPAIAPALFYIGVGAVVTMAAGLLAATILRIVRSRGGRPAPELTKEPGEGHGAAAQP